MAKVLRTLSHPDFSTKGIPLTKEEADQDLIEIWNEAESALDPSDLTDQSFDLDVNSISVNGTNLFPNNDPQDLGIGDDVEFESIDINGSTFVDSSRNVVVGDITANGSHVFTSTLFRIERDSFAFLDLKVPNSGVSTDRGRLDWDGNLLELFNVDNTSNFNLRVRGDTRIFGGDLTVDNSLNINGTQFVDSSRNVTANQGTFNNLSISVSPSLLIDKAESPSRFRILGAGSGYGAYPIHIARSGVKTEVEGNLNVVEGIDINDSTFVDSSRNVTANEGTFSARLQTQRALSSDYNHYELADAIGTVRGVVGLESSSGDIYIGTDNNNKALKFDRSDSSRAIFSFDVSISNTLTINSQLLFDLGKEQNLSDDADVTFHNLSLIGDDVTSDGGTQPSGGFLLRGFYDSDGTSGVTSTAYDATIQHIVTDPLPSSKVSFSFDGNEVAYVQHDGAMFIDNGEQVANQTWVDNNYDNYVNWTLEDDDDQTHAVSSGYTVHIAGGDNLTTSSTSTTNTTTFTIDIDGDFVPVSGGSFTGLVTFESGIKVENTAVPFLDIQVTDNSDNPVARFQDDGGATIASIETDGFDGAGAGYVNLADAWRVGDEPIASETWVDNNYDNYSNWNLQTDDGVLENIVGADNVYLLGGTGIDTTDTTTGSTTEVTFSIDSTVLQGGDNVSELTNDAGYITSAPVDSVFGRTGAVTAEASDYNSFFYEQSHIDQNFDKYETWNLQTDDGVLENIVSNDNVYILGGDGITTSDTTTGSTTEVTISLDGDLSPWTDDGDGSISYNGRVTIKGGDYNFVYETVEGWTKIREYGHLYQHNKTSSMYWGMSSRADGSWDVSGTTTDPSGGNLSPSTIGIKILSNGNVGIGTTSPSSKLDVNGGGTFTDDITRTGQGATNRRFSTSLDPSGDYLGLLQLQDGAFRQCAGDIHGHRTSFAFGFYLDFYAESGWDGDYSPSPSDSALVATLHAGNGSSSDARLVQFQDSGGNWWIGIEYVSLDGNTTVSFSGSASSDYNHITTYPQIFNSSDISNIGDYTGNGRDSASTINLNRTIVKEPNYSETSAIFEGNIVADSGEFNDGLVLPSTFAS